MDASSEDVEMDANHAEASSEEECDEYDQASNSESDEEAFGEASYDEGEEFDEAMDGEHSFFAMPGNFEEDLRGLFA